jgi:hypothetical protein
MILYNIFAILVDLEPLEFEVPMVCLATGCVSLRRDTRYYCLHLIDLNLASAAHFNTLHAIELATSKCRKVNIAVFFSRITMVFIVNPSCLSHLSIVFSKFSSVFLI